MYFLSIWSKRAIFPNSSSQWYLIHSFTAFIVYRMIFFKCPRKSVKTCALENFPLATRRSFRFGSPSGTSAHSTLKNNICYQLENNNYYDNGYSSCSEYTANRSRDVEVGLARSDMPEGERKTITMIGCLMDYAVYAKQYC